MPLNSGSRLGHYDVTALIGEGGMGRVYQATDTKLKRQVALKILPEAFSADPERLARFQREAEVLASLNHPGIAAIYGLEEAEGTRALVLELVEGPTLADRIKRGPILLDEALPIAKQIAEALEAAHEAGVIHRDLKPANIKVREDGTVKVLDFGLAKAFQPDATGDPSQSPTLTAAATQMGVIMGTAAYMSPEQARGKPVDKRADIWAFGCVLYEMLTGQMAFHGEDVSLTLASVMKSDLNVKRLPDDIPPTVRTTLRRCLEKDPAERIRDIGDVQLAMRGAFETAAAAPSEPIVAPPLKVWKRPLTLTLAGIVLMAMTALTTWRVATTPEAQPRVERFLLPPGDSETFMFGSDSQDIAISPDGSHFIFGGRSRNLEIGLSLRAIDELVSKPMEGLGDLLFGPFISPDGQWIGFNDQSDHTLKKVSIRGGPAVTICETDGAFLRGASWRADDTIVFGTNTSSGLWSVSASDGTPAELTRLDEATGQTNHVWPHLLPGGHAVLFTIQSGTATEDWQIAVLELDTGDQRVLVQGGTSPRYSPTGHIIYGARGTLRAVPFDLARLEVTDASPVPVLPSVIIKENGAANFDLAQDGSLIYATPASGRGLDSTLVWVDRSGRQMPSAVSEARPYSSPRLSPDGTRLAVAVLGDNPDV